METGKIIITGILDPDSRQEFIDGQALATGPLAGFINVQRGQVVVDITQLFASGKMTREEIETAVEVELGNAGYKIAA
ncbi:MAG: hypothetical protein WC840_04895 [Candidatus Peribacteraceae bacterium]